MSEPAYEQSTLFPVDSPVSLSLLPGSKRAKMMTVTSGLKCSELYGRSDQLGSLVKMCLESSIWHSTRCYLTWKTKATPLNRLLFRLAVSMPHTNENEYVLWPTPSTGAALCAGTGNFQTLLRMKEKGMITEEERKNLSQGNGGKTNPELLEWLMGYQKAFTGLLPTPRASDYKGSPMNRYVGGVHYRHQLDELLEVTPLGKIGLTNPAFVEWLMGYPIGWTELSALETQSFRSSSIHSSQQ